VNNLDLSVELGAGCAAGRYLGNELDQNEQSVLRTCDGTADSLNNVEVIRFFGTAGTSFTVRVKGITATNQDFALVVYNAHRSDKPTPPQTPATLTATAASATRVDLTWPVSAGATTYDVQRSTGINDPYVTLPNSPATNSYADTSVVGGRTYLYRVRARNVTAVSDFTPVDPATTVLFQDDPLIAGTTTVKAAHITELRAAATAMRQAAALSAYSWTDPTIIGGTTLIDADHLIDLRLAIDGARIALGLATMSYTDDPLSQGTVVKALHAEELRGRVK
jgi:hypothetical protein